MLSLEKQINLRKRSLAVIKIDLGRPKLLNAVRLLVLVNARGRRRPPLPRHISRQLDVMAKKMRLSLIYPGIQHSIQESHPSVIHMG